MDSFTKQLDKASPQELFDLLLQLNEAAKGTTDPVEKDLLLTKISLLKDKVGQFEIKADNVQGGAVSKVKKKLIGLVLGICHKSLCYLKSLKRSTVGSIMR